MASLAENLLTVITALSAFKARVGAWLGAHLGGRARIYEIPATRTSFAESSFSVVVEDVLTLAKSVEDTRESTRSVDDTRESTRLPGAVGGSCGHLRHDTTSPSLKEDFKVIKAEVSASIATGNVQNTPPLPGNSTAEAGEGALPTFLAKVAAFFSAHLRASGDYLNGHLVQEVRQSVQSVQFPGSSTDIPGNMLNSAERSKGTISADSVNIAVGPPVVPNVPSSSVPGPSTPKSSSRFFDHIKTSIVSVLLGSTAMDAPKTAASVGKDSWGSTTSGTRQDVNERKGIEMFASAPGTSNDTDDSSYIDISSSESTVKRNTTNTADQTRRKWITFRQWIRQLHPTFHCKRPWQRTRQLPPESSSSSNDTRTESHSVLPVFSQSRPIGGTLERVPSDSSPLLVTVSAHARLEITADGNQSLAKSVKISRSHHDLNRGKKNIRKIKSLPPLKPKLIVVQPLNPPSCEELHPLRDSNGRASTTSDPIQPLCGPISPPQATTPQPRQRAHTIGAISDLAATRRHWWQRRRRNTVGVMPEHTPRPAWLGSGSDKNRQSVQILQGNRPLERPRE